MELTDRLCGLIEEAGGYRALHNKNMLDEMEDVLGYIFARRYHAMREMVAEKGWKHGNITGAVIDGIEDGYYCGVCVRSPFNEQPVSFALRNSASGKNIIALRFYGIQDNLDCTPEQFVERVHALASAKESFERLDEYKDYLEREGIDVPETVQLSEFIRELQSEDYVYPGNENDAEDDEDFSATPGM